MKNVKGFTLVELVLVITILAVLSVAAIPQFMDTREASESSARRAVVEGVNASVMADYSDRLQATARDGLAGDVDYAANLGETGAASGDDCSSVGCFGSILQTPIYDPHWQYDGVVNGDFIYVFTTGTGVTLTYRYDPTTGAFNSSTP